MSKTNNSSSSEQRNRVKRWRQAILPFMVKLTITATALLFAYLIYLDAQVQHKFEGNKWQVPIQVFSRVESIQMGDTLTSKQLSHQLQLRGYQAVAHATHAGEFSQNGGQFLFIRRAFDFPSGPEASQAVDLKLRAGRVSHIDIDGQPSQHIQLDPLLLERLVNSDKEDRLVVERQDFPESLIDTLLLVEDKDFYFHHGVSLTGIARAFISNIKAGRAVQGGSTLTQQLAKNMFLTREKKIWRKVTEALMALILEYRYSKDQILEAYLNEVYLGQHYANGIYGFGLGAKFYFGKTVRQLNASDIALLIAQVKGPSYYDPWRYPERAKTRRDLVLRVMAENNLISRQDYQQAVEQGLGIRQDRRLKQHSYPAFMQVVKRELNQYFNLDVMQQGVRIFTTLSPFIQHNVEAEVAQVLPQLEKAEAVSQLQTAVVVSDIASGAILAVVGDREPAMAGFNRAINAKRSIGSLIKPFIYLAALERFEQYHLASPLADEPISIATEAGKEWTPKNYDGTFSGQTHLLDALVFSLNIPTVNLGLALGLHTLPDTLNVLGLDVDPEPTPAVLLGALELSPLEVNQLYATLANQGQHVNNYSIERIMSAQGETLYSNQQQATPLLSAQGAYLINYALAEVTQRGTARSLTWRLPDYKLAGKTGTSNDLRDSWFVGYDNRHIVTTWIGRDDNAPMGLTGSSGAVPLFASIMQELPHQSLSLSMPAGVEWITFDATTGVATLAQCEQSITVPAIRDGISQFADCATKPEKKKQNWFERLFGG